MPKFVVGQAPKTEGFEVSVSYEDIHQRACRAGNSGDSFIATADFQRQSFVIDTKCREDGRMQVAKLDGTFGCYQSDLVGRADAETFSDPPTGHPDCKSSGVMLSAHISLFHRCPTEFACPDDQGRIEESVLFQVRQESCDTDVGPSGSGGVVFGKLCVRIPTIFVWHIVELNEADPLLDEPTGQQALARETLCSSLGRIDPIEFMNVLRFVLKTTDLQGGGLHAVSQFVRGDSGIEFRRSGVLITMKAIEFVEQIERWTSAASQRLGRDQMMQGWV